MLSVNSINICLYLKRFGTCSIVGCINLVLTNYDNLNHERNIYLVVRCMCMICAGIKKPLPSISRFLGERELLISSHECRLLYIKWSTSTATTLLCTVTLHPKPSTAQELCTQMSTSWMWNVYNNKLLTSELFPNASISGQYSIQ